MPIDFSYLTGITLGALLLGGCVTDGSDSMVSSVSNWGEANRQTFAAQVIDPAPVHADAVPQSSGEQAARAIDRLRTDKVKKPERIKTTNIGSQGSGAAGGN